MKLDRSRQMEILQTLASCYPNLSALSQLSGNPFEEDYKNWVANVMYLKEHGLIEGKFMRETGNPRMSANIKITASGMDFLEDDGGIGAILGAVTIKLHADTLKDLIEMRILQSDLSQPDKQKFLDGLRELPAESIKHLTMKLIDLALDKVPGALQSLSTFF